MSRNGRPQTVRGLGQWRADPARRGRWPEFSMDMRAQIALGLKQKLDSWPRRPRRALHGGDAARRSAGAGRRYRQRLRAGRSPSVRGAWRVRWRGMATPLVSCLVVRSRNRGWMARSAGRSTSSIPRPATISRCSSMERAARTDRPWPPSASGCQISESSMADQVRSLDMRATIRSDRVVAG